VAFVVHDDDMADLRAAMRTLAEFNEKLDSYRDMPPTPEQAAGLIVDQQAAADTCVAAFQANVRRRMPSRAAPQ